jgi:hypothetical protein
VLAGMYMDVATLLCAVCVCVGLHLVLFPADWPFLPSLSVTVHE